MSDMSGGGAAPSGGGVTEGAPLVSQQSEAVAADAAAAAAAKPAAGSDDLGKFGEHGKYIKELRDEAAKHRTASQPYTDAFGEFGDEDRTLWLGVSKELASAIKSGDPARIASAADKLDNVTKGLRDSTKPPEPVADSTATGLTQADVDRLLDQRDATRAIQEKTKSLGYEDGSPDHHQLLWLAVNKTGNDLDKAHEMIVARDQAIFDRMAGKKSKVSTGQAPVTQTGTPGSGQKIGGWADSKAALRAALDAQ